MNEYDLKIVNNIIPIIHKYFPDIVFDLNNTPISLSIIDTISKYLDDKKSRCSRCVNEMNIIGKTDPGSMGLMN